MKFTLDSHGALPAYQQIQQEIRLALLLGVLRPGDTLPSIRDAERESNISRNIVRKAYLDLRRSGILTLHHGKGVLVDKELSYSQRTKVMEQCEKLSVDTLSRVERLGISTSAFARYLYQKARTRERSTTPIIFVDATNSLAQERASTISSHWQVNVRGLSFDDLGSMRHNEFHGVRTVLTNYWRLDEVRKRFNTSRVKVLPVSLTFTQEMRDELSKLPLKASVILVLDDRDFSSLSLILEPYRTMIGDPSVKLSATPYSKIRDLEEFLKSAEYQKVIFSNRIWDRIPEKLRKHRRVTRPRMEIDLASLESVRIHAGVIM